MSELLPSPSTVTGPSHTEFHLTTGLCLFFLLLPEEVEAQWRRGKATCPRNMVTKWRVDCEPRPSDSELLVWAITLSGLWVLEPRGEQQRRPSRSHSWGMRSSPTLGPLLQAGLFFFFWWRRRIKFWFYEVKKFWKLVAQRCKCT